jgi:cellulose synthase/poly-beta-1,6-N-acetylglucosamine synthase-like glycosyltransferase
MVSAFFPSSFFLFWWYTSKRSRRHNPGIASDVKGFFDGASPWSVSVIVPAYNEGTNISTCLESLLRQDFSGDMEILLVNDGSTDRTAEIVSRYPVNLIDLKTNLGKAQALNAGIEKAKKVFA